MGGPPDPTARVATHYTAVRTARLDRRRNGGLGIGWGRPGTKNQELFGWCTILLLEKWCCACSCRVGQRWW